MFMLTFVLSVSSPISRVITGRRLPTLSRSTMKKDPSKEFRVANTIYKNEEIFASTMGDSQVVFRPDRNTNRIIEFQLVSPEAKVS